MAQPSTSVISALPAVGICPVTFRDGPTIRIYELDGGHLVAYDKHTWPRELIDDYARMYFGDYELIEPAKDGA